MDIIDRKRSYKFQILIIDDEEGFVNVLAKRLSKRGIKAAKANSGSAGIQALRKRDFDCVLLDLKMEDMNGIEVLKILKKMAPDLPVIMLTGHGCDASAEEGISLGADAYLIKPYTFETLVTKIKKIAGGVYEGKTD